MPVKMLFRWIFRTASSRRAVDSVLEGHAWKVYGYKFGQWRYERPFWTQPIVFLNGWWRWFDTFQLIDLTTGRPIGEMVARNRTPWGTHRMRKFSGTVEFAGDPAFLGVYRTPGDTHCVFTHTRWGKYRSAAQAAREMNTGATPQARFRDEVAERRRCWLDFKEKMDLLEGTLTIEELIDGEYIGRPWIVDYPY